MRGELEGLSFAAFFFSFNHPTLPSSRSIYFFYYRIETRFSLNRNPIVDVKISIEFSDG